MVLKPATSPGIGRRSPLKLRKQTSWKMPTVSVDGIGDQPCVLANASEEVTPSLGQKDTAHASLGSKCCKTNGFRVVSVIGGAVLLILDARFLISTIVFPGKVSGRGTVVNESLLLTLVIVVTSLELVATLFMIMGAIKDIRPFLTLWLAVFVPVVVLFVFRLMVAILEGASPSHVTMKLLLLAAISILWLSVLTRRQELQDSDG